MRSGCSLGKFTLLKTTACIDNHAMLVSEICKWLVMNTSLIPWTLAVSPVVKHTLIDAMPEATPRLATLCVIIVPP